METIFFMLDSLAITLLVFTSLQNDKRRPDEPQTGLFRYSETRRVAAPTRKRPDWVKDDQV